MNSKNRTKSSVLPNAGDIAKLYQDLGLSELFNVPYNRELQMRRFRKVSLYADNQPCYATGNTRPGQQPKEI